MRILAIETATEACSVALFEQDAGDDEPSLLAHDHRVLGRGHAERLVPMIAGLPDRGKSSRVFVSRGPGSFTGVRIGIAAARALAFAWGATLAGYPTLALVAAMARSQRPATAVDVCMTGGHGEWYCQSFGNDGQPTGSHASSTPEAAARQSTAGLIAGTQADALAVLRNDAEALNFHPDARHAFAIPQSLFTADVSPIYGRAPDAKPAA
ncbi:tRNA threonylcarbamoyladenosine biosynthesis protein TsaB [Alteripontixanthobacter maritimus]|uniref:tRNA threonylcarbamoyladenosine biosynthesis protein TsaB n=1 Tax=Alteripontixanthobacter maritimus TaxID=2161824 RepID=A0A369Q9L1_9SPHN|nr:tRNA (adenosine(37)-N6)-threonylcarbamoyltransferase complex dimerization subunit type 1 TsaB [Alteripontixanthobacter maritimus]RDC59599.1 tRNA threonylcarbamoyladenosine biosynthesis protein TsaB [Alteripontixanthobacter maritimus]